MGGAIKMVKLKKEKAEKEVKPIPEKIKKPTKPKKIKKAKFNGETSSRKNLVLVSSAIIASIGFAAIIFVTLSSLFSTESYYVLNENVKAKQAITPEMVVSRETASGTAPVNSLDMETIQRGGVFSMYPLYAGDVISASNAGSLSGQSLGVPDDWGVTSFTINSNDAVGGTLGKGDYIDIMGINGNGAQYIFNNLLILDTKFVNEEIDVNAEGRTIVGELIHYTVGLPAEDLAYFESAMYNYSDGEESGLIKVIKAPYVVNYTDRDVSELDKPFKYNSSTGNLDIIEGTDPTFTDIERDKDGRPVSGVIEVDGEQVEEDATNELEENDTSSEDEIQPE